MKQQTIKYYDDNALKLIDDYDNANMSKVHKILDKYISHDNNVLDIGFGSGRDIRYLSSKNINIWGVDSSEVFVNTFKKKYPKLSNHIFHSTLPKLYFKDDKENFFDTIYSIATWMHLPKNDYSKAILAIKKILSYSYTPRLNDPRFFETIVPEDISILLEDLEFKLIESIKSDDGLKRKKIKWVTQVYKLVEKR